MSNLFHAGIWRLKKNRMFWICIAFTAGYGMLACLLNYRTMLTYEVIFTPEEMIFTFLVIAGIVLAAVLGLFTGTEYSEGTIRNKIVTGRSREQIYLSGLLVSMTAAAFLYAAGLAAACGLAIPLFGTVQASASAFLWTAFDGLLACIAYAALFHAVAMVQESRAHTVLVCVLGAFVILFAGIYLTQKLGAPETVIQTRITAGEMVTVTVDNPGYLSGFRRELYAFFLELLPSGQTLLTAAGPAGGGNHVRMAVLALCDTAVCTAAGLFLFRRKDLK